MLKKSKKGIVPDYLGWLILAVALLFFVIVGIIILKGKGISALDYIKTLFRFGK